MEKTIFTHKNFVLLAVSLLLLVVGYVLLGQGPVNNPLSMSVAPVVLVAVYCILIPYAIVARDRKSPDRDDQPKKTGV